MKIFLKSDFFLGSRLLPERVALSSSPTILFLFQNKIKNVTLEFRKFALRYHLQRNDRSVRILIWIFLISRNEIKKKIEIPMGDEQNGVGAACKNFWDQHTTFLH